MASIHLSLGTATEAKNYPNSYNDKTKQTRYVNRPTITSRVLARFDGIPSARCSPLVSAQQVCYIRPCSRLNSLARKSFVGRLHGITRGEGCFGLDYSGQKTAWKGVCHEGHPPEETIESTGMRWTGGHSCKASHSNTPSTQI